MAETDRRFAAKEKATRFQQEVERCVKRCNPAELAISLSTVINRVHSNPDLMAQWPIHYMMHAIEACCAYHRRGYNEPITETLLRKIINVYNTYYDPLSEYHLTESNRLDVFFAMYARQQFYLQGSASRFDLARGVLLFNEASYPKTSIACLNEFGFGFQDWMLFCFTLHAGLMSRSVPIITPDYFLAIKGQVIPPERLANLFSVLSATIDEVGEAYRSTRLKYGILYDPFFPSSFSTRPFLNLGNGQYLAPHNGLVLEQGVGGLFDFGKDHWKEQFGAEFGSAFEKYIGSILTELPTVGIYTEGDMRRHTDKEICDYIIVTGDSVLFLECKAVEYSAATSSEGAIKGDNSTTKIAKAVDQLFSAARQVARGELAALLGDVRGRRFVGIVATFRHIYMVNTDDYWERAILPRASAAEVREWNALFAFRPQTLDVNELEQLILLARNGTSPADIFQDKLRESEYLIGEWTTYLEKRTQGMSLARLDKVFEEFTDGIIQRMKDAGGSE